jgi:hypothetical protein
MTQRTIEIIAFFGVLLIAALALHAWLASREEQQRLQSTLATQKKLLDAAGTRESDRNATLTDALAQIAALKRTVQTPEQIVRDLPNYLSLPQPITLAPPSATNAPSPHAAGKISKQGTGLSPNQGVISSGTTLVTPQPSPSNAITDTAQNSLPDALQASVVACDPSAGCTAQLPPADLKPLYDYVQDCRACQAELAVAKQNAADDAVKISALTTERDAAITASKGGTFWRRLRRDALWFAVGTAVGSAAGYVAATRSLPN